MIKGLGWHPPLPNAHRKKYEDHFSITSNPPSVDLESLCPPIYDQGALGSCTANAAAGMAQFLVRKENLWDFVPSRLAIYYWTREKEGTTSQDAGASVQDAVATLYDRGSPNEALFWYNISKFAVKPSHNIVNDAAKHKCDVPLSVPQNLNYMQTCLASGYPFAIGFTVYSSFENIGSDGIMPMPLASESILGGHSCLVIAYDDSTRYFKVRNSWGNWGLRGNFLMPYDFLLNGNYASDFWTCNKIVELP